MNIRRSTRIALALTLSLAAAGASASDPSVRLSEVVAERTDQVLLAVNEQLGRRIARESTRSLTAMGDRPPLRPVPMALQAGRERRTVSLQR